MKGEKIQIEEPRLIKELLRREENLSVWKKLVFLNAMANYKIPFEEAAEILLLPHPTVYEWIREWNRYGYEGLVSRENLRTGRRPKLGEEDIKRLEGLLRQRNLWLTSEVVELILKEFGVRLSEDQVRRILRDKLNMNFSKPYPKDYRRPDNAEEALVRQLELSYKYLTEAKGYSFDDIAIGFVDETAPQLTANTVRVWSFGKPELKKNTQKMKANTMGFYPIKGKSAREFTVDSKIESFLGFLKRVRRENNEYKAVIIVLDNFPTHRSKQVTEKAEEMEIYLVYLPPYSPDLNPIEFIWRSIRRVISLSFVKHLDGLKQIVGHTFDVLSQRLSFARSWVEKVLVRVAPCYAELCI
jgi:transposase